MIVTVSLYPQEERIWETVVIEDFEKNVYSQKDFKVRLENVSLPDVKISSTLTSPLLDSDKSLLVRITDNINTPVELFLKNKYSTGKYLGALVYHVYSSGSDAVLYMGLLDAEQNYKRIRIGSLNFQGWRTIRVNIKDRLLQDDVIFNRHEEVTLQSIYIYMGSSGKNLKESIIILDDIQAEVRDKYRVPEELKNLTY